MSRLFLIPSFIGGTSPDFLPERSLKEIRQLKCFIVEREKTARAFLKQLDHPIPQSDFIIHELDKHKNYSGFETFFDKHIGTHDIGVISEAGLPAVADPGGKIVSYAHQKNSEVMPLAGSSSIFLALMASGMNGQRFEFHGYLPVDNKERLQALKQMESRCAYSTQIFMETPYRNNAFLNWLLSKLPKQLRLCVACDLESPSQWIKSAPVSQWKKDEVDLHKRPCIFLIFKD